MWTHTLDGQAMSLSEIRSATGIAPLRIKRACEQANPTTMAELKDAVRAYLSQPRGHRTTGSSYVWNGSASSPSRKGHPHPEVRAAERPRQTKANVHGMSAKTIPHMVALARHCAKPDDGTE